MKRNTFIVGLALVVFLVVNGASYLLMSDGYGVQKVYDGVQRAGFPFRFWERGGIYYRHWFSISAFALDLAVAVVLAFCIAFLYRRVKR